MFCSACSVTTRPKVRFAPDSALEGDGFEPSVPVAREPVILRKVNLRGDRRAAKKIWRGTDGSNPSPSSRQSVSLPQSFSKVENPAFRAGLGCWLGDRVGRDARVFRYRTNWRQYLCRAEFQYRSEADVVARLPRRSQRSRAELNVR